MLSALIVKAQTPMALAATLSSLVPGAVEGLVREVLVLDLASEDIRRVADHAGCRVLETNELVAQAGQIKGDWIMIADAGERLQAGWVELAGLHIGSQSGAKPNGARLRPSDPPPFWRFWIGRRQGPLLLPKAHLARHLATRPTLEGITKGLMVLRLREGR